jgi:UDP-N-acetylbacillosamine N-acetyltransferase
MEKIVIWGASGHAMVVADIIRLVGRYEIIGFIDNVNPHRRGSEFCGSQILGGEEQLEMLLNQGIDHIIFGFGNCEARLRLSEHVKPQGFHIASAIHPRAIIASDVTIGAGTVIMGGAVINSGTRIGENVIINTSASVDHECDIRDGAHICPGVHLAGKVIVGRGAWVGIGSCVVDHLSIGSGSLIGAGAVVVTDIPDNVIAYGNPAKVKGSNKG